MAHAPVVMSYPYKEMEIAYLVLFRVVCIILKTGIPKQY